MRLTNKAKFAIVGFSFLALAGITMLILAICLKWDIVGGLTSPVAIVCYAFIGVLIFSVGAYLIKRKISGD